MEEKQNTSGQLLSHPAILSPPFFFFFFPRQVSAALSGYLTAVQDTEDTVKLELQMLSDSLVQSNDLPVIAQVALRVCGFYGFAGYYASLRVFRVYLVYNIWVCGLCEFARLCGFYAGFCGFFRGFCGVFRFCGFCGIVLHGYCGYLRVLRFLLFFPPRFFRVCGSEGLVIVVFLRVLRFCGSKSPPASSSLVAELEWVSYSSPCEVCGVSQP